MKKIFFLFAVLVASATVSCTREEVRGGVAPVSEGEMVTFKVGISAAQTKATDTSDILEEAVNSLQVFVFSDDGWLERSVRTNGSSSVEISCFAGQKEVVAIVNAPEIDWGDVPTLEDLNAFATNLADNDLTNFVMYGERSAYVPDGEFISIEVSRRVARVVLKGVKNEITSSSAVSSFSLNAVYLLNVAADNDYGCSTDYVPSDWYNQSRYDGEKSEDELKHVYDPSSSPYTFLYDEIGVALPGPDDPYYTEHVFYCYPNFTSQPTRLVVEGILNNHIWYYPVTLDTVEPNCSYEVELIITGAGAASPDSDAQIDDFLFTISVDEWDLKKLGNGGTYTF